MSHLNIGILAHVDAGKTTLSEAILYHTGTTRKLGRVDHGDAYLDTNEMEKERGITIFSKQAEFVLPDGKNVTLLDTPGHVDFSPEMERTLSVLDYAVLIVSALDGVDGRLPVLWKLLSFYHVPTFFFVNKMDRPGTDRAALLKSIEKQFGEGCLDLSKLSLGKEEALNGPLSEKIAVLDENLLSAYLEEERPVSLADIRRLIRERKLFPVSFGSALEDAGVEDFLSLLSLCMEEGKYGDRFGAKVYKITREDGKRLSWMKVTGGTLKAKQVISYKGSMEEEKVQEIRRYSGGKYEAIPEALPGEIVAVTGLSGTKAGMGLGAEEDRNTERLLQPILKSAVILPPGMDVHKAYRDLKILEEEEPELSFYYDPELKEISARVSGEVEIEILTRLILERFDMQVAFGPGRILYKETIRGEVEGVGHFEPLRHYAEVHLLLQEGMPGSGIVFENRCRVEDLTINEQKLILSELQNMHFAGVLTGSELTDIKITLLSGKSSVKHTEGGDFREAAGRAVRQGLMMAENILLEPILSFSLSVPGDCVGHALSDLSAMGAEASIKESNEKETLITGKVSAKTLGNYAVKLSAYTGGKGSLSTGFDGYEPCGDPEAVIEERGYIAELDTANPSSSVFCSHGAGTIIPWNEVRDYMHVDTGWRPDAGFVKTEEDEESLLKNAAAFHARRAGEKKEGTFAEREAERCAFDSELKEIFEKTYGKIRTHTEDEEANTYGAPGWKRKKMGDSALGSDGQGYGKTAAGDPHRGRRSTGDEYLLVDGYNIIYAWPELRALSETDIKAARDRLIDILTNYGGMSPESVILVFDAYKVQGGKGEVYHLPNLDVIYTKEAETADLYIEKAAHELGRKNYRVTVATSDLVEQVIIFGSGAVRLSANGLKEKVEWMEKELRDKYGV